MRCRSELERERERLVKALAATRAEMRGSTYGSTPLKLALDEANLQGQIKAIDYAISCDEGGWPHDAWFVFIECRRDAILSLLRAGKDFDEILETLNLTEVQARLIVKLDEPTDPGSKN